MSEDEKPTTKRGSRKTVAIVGAGVAGLTATKTALEHGLTPTCYEQRMDIGGIWNQSEESEHINVAAGTWKDIRSNSAKTWYCFSDFPHKKSTPFLPRAEHIKEYLDDYAEEFGVRNCIQFNREVKSVLKAKDYDQTGRWTVVTCNAEAKDDMQEESYDSVLCCSGYFNKAHWPAIADQSNYSGSIIHSGQFRSATKYEGQRVAVVGSGASAVDIASTLAPFAQQIHLIVRPEGLHVLPQFVKGNKSWESLFTHRRINSAASLSKTKKVWKRAIEEQLNHDRLGLCPTKPLFSTPLAISNDIDQWILSGKVKVIKGEVVYFTENGPQVRGLESPTEVDHVIYATGYESGLPYLDDKDINPAKGNGNDKQASSSEWWNYIYPVHQSYPTLFTIGHAYFLGAAPPVFELQARAACGVLSGNLKLPHADLMAERIATEQQSQMDNVGKLPGIVNSFQYSLELSKFIGCYPSLSELAKADPKLAYRSWNGPLLPAHFRLFGDHAQWEQARQTVRESPKNWAFWSHRERKHYKLIQHERRMEAIKKNGGHIIPNDVPLDDPTSPELSSTTDPNLPGTSSNGGYRHSTTSFTNEALEITEIDDGPSVMSTNAYHQ